MVRNTPELLIPHSVMCSQIDAAVGAANQGIIQEYLRLEKHLLWMLDEEEHDAKATGPASTLDYLARIYKQRRNDKLRSDLWAFREKFLGSTPLPPLVVGHISVGGGFPGKDSWESIERKPEEYVIPRG